MRLLLVATIVLSALSAFFAFQTRIRGTQCSEERDVARKGLQEAQHRLTKGNGEKKDLETKLKEIELKSDKLKQDSEKMRSDLANLQAESTQASAAVKQKDAEISKLKEEMTRQKPEDPKPAMAEAEAKIAELRNQLERSQQTAQELEKRAESLAQKLEESAKKKEIEVMKKAAVAQREAVKNVVGRVLAYNEGWNFAVLNIGDRHGVTPETQLEVRRDGIVVAKLQVTQVQPTQCTAGVISQSTGKQLKFLSSDSVVFSRQQAPNGLETALVP